MITLFHISNCNPVFGCVFVESITAALDLNKNSNFVNLCGYNFVFIGEYILQFLTAYNCCLFDAMVEIGKFPNNLQNEMAAIEKDDKEHVLEIEDEKLNDNKQNKPGVQVKENKNDEQFEELFQKHYNAVGKVKENYLCVYKDMMSKLRAHHLEPLAELLRKHEDVNLEHLEVIAEKIGTKLNEQMSLALEAFWNEYNIESSMAKLEILKDEFKDYEGHDWNMYNKTLAERVRPKTMRMKKAKQVYLERQIQNQSEHLEKVLEENRQWRKRIQNISNRRCFLHAEMTKYSERFKEDIPHMKNLLLELLEFI